VAVGPIRSLGGVRFGAERGDLHVEL